MRDYPGSSNDYSKVYSEKWIQNVILLNKGKFGLSLFSSIFRSLVLLLPTLLVKQIINRSIPQENIPDADSVKLRECFDLFCDHDADYSGFASGKIYLGCVWNIAAGHVPIFSGKTAAGVCSNSFRDTTVKFVDETEGAGELFLLRLWKFNLVNTTVFAGVGDHGGTESAAGGIDDCAHDPADCADPENQ